MTALLLILALIGYSEPLMADEMAAKVEYTGSAFRDPFVEKVDQSATVAAAANEEESALRAMRIQGILTSGGTPRAIIEGKIHKRGDPLLSAKITEIRKEGVFVLLGEKNILIPYLRPRGPSQSQPASSAPAANTRTPKQEVTENV